MQFYVAHYAVVDTAVQLGIISVLLLYSRFLTSFLCVSILSVLSCLFECNKATINLAV